MNQQNSEFKNSNKLINEKSPYLLQHASNPVNWFPWSEEAFSKAKQEDKPIFLSIGFAKSGYCQKMQEESFTNPKIAQLLNNTFINIKVDFEELPEIGRIYTHCAQALNPSVEEFPINMILTSDLYPFFAISWNNSWILITWISDQNWFCNQPRVLSCNPYFEHFS